MSLGTPENSAIQKLSIIIIIWLSSVTQCHFKSKLHAMGVEWSKDRTQAAESIKWRPQQAYGSSQVLLAQPQTIFSTPKIDKRTAQATGNTLSLQ